MLTPGPSGCAAGPAHCTNPAAVEVLARRVFCLQRLGLGAKEVSGLCEASALALMGCLVLRPRPFVKGPHSECFEFEDALSVAPAVTRPPAPWTKSPALEAALGPSSTPPWDNLGLCSCRRRKSHSFSSAATA